MFSLLLTIAPRSFPAGLLYSPSLPSLCWRMGSFCAGAELCTFPCWTSGFSVGCYLSVYQLSLHGVASSANLVCQPMTALLDHVSMGWDMSAVSGVFWILCLGFCLDQLLLAPKTILVKRSRTKWTFCSEMVFCPFWGEDLQRSLICNLLGFISD